MFGTSKTNPIGSFRLSQLNSSSVQAQLRAAGIDTNSKQYKAAVRMMTQNGNSAMYANVQGIKNLMKSYDKGGDYIDPTTGLAGLLVTEENASSRKRIISIPESSKDEMFEQTRKEFLRENGVLNGDTTKRSDVYTNMYRKVQKNDRLAAGYTMEQYERAYRQAFLDAARKADPKENGVLSAEDDAAYTKMEQEITDLGKEIARLERQEELDAELNRPVNKPLTGKPGGNAGADGAEDKTGRASDEYRKNFWNAMRSKAPVPNVTNALQIGTDSEGGYLVPDEFENTLVEALEEENIFRQMAKIIQTASGDRKIPVVASKGTAAWMDEEGAYPESDDSFGQVSIGAYKLGTMIKVSEELLNDSVFDLESYITREFARRIGSKEEEAFFTGNGTGKPLGILAAWDFPLTASHQKAWGLQAA